MDEISQIYGISERKIDFLERLKKNCVKMQEDGVVTQMPTASPPEIRQLFLSMIDGAMSDIKEDNQTLPSTINELRNSLDDVSLPIIAMEHGNIEYLTMPSFFSFAQLNRTS